MYYYIHLLLITAISVISQSCCVMITLSHIEEETRKKVKRNR